MLHCCCNRVGFVTAASNSVRYGHGPGKFADSLNDLRLLRFTEIIRAEISRMTQPKLSELTDQELLDQAKTMKSSALTHAFLIGLMIGVVIYGVAQNNLGFFMLFPLFLAFKVFHKPGYKESSEAMDRQLEERGLK